jgi:hypothetical protein
MKTRTRTRVQYDNCNDCQYCEFPDEKGEIKFPGGVLRLAPYIFNKEGEKIPNRILARCGVDGKKLTCLDGCEKWIDIQIPDRIEAN